MGNFSRRVLAHFTLLFFFSFWIIVKHLVWDIPLHFELVRPHAWRSKPPLDRVWFPHISVHDNPEWKEKHVVWMKRRTLAWKKFPIEEVLSFEKYDDYDKQVSQCLWLVSGSASSLGAHVLKWNPRLKLTPTDVARIQEVRMTIEEW